MNEVQRIQDQLLVLRAQANPEALDALVRRWNPALLRHAMRYTRNTDVAWDVVQEAWCAIYRKLEGLKDAAAFPKWAFCVVTNKCRDYARSEKRRSEVMQAFTVELKKPDPPATGNKRLDAALARIDPDQRVLLELFYVESFSIREIAEITGSPEGSIKSRLYRARQELKRLMEDEKDG
ncbi:MAG: RNA polymerase sigma factor [Candidatus Hydrogenedentes bacterium]|nr:RNA polymerase sigma factor [Candidatus Hydrogenedentota bacterium]